MGLADVQQCDQTTDKGEPCRPEEALRPSDGRRHHFEPYGNEQHPILFKGSSSIAFDA